MATKLYIFFILVNVVSSRRGGFSKSRRDYGFDEESVRNYLCSEYEKQASQMCTKAVIAEWNHLVDIKNKTKAELSVNATVESARFDQEMWNNYFKSVDEKGFESSNLVREVTRIKNLGNSALDEDRLAELTTVINDMTELYSMSKICPYSKPKCNLSTEGLSMDPDIDDVMASSSDYDELLYTWVTWREQTGAKIKTLYLSYVELSNEAATANNFSDKGDMWRNEYEWPNMEKDLESLWQQIAPLYNELHAYVLHKLRFEYQKEMADDEDEYIPAHILGNMWGQNWINIRSIVKPFPDEPDIDITRLLLKKKYTPLKMFQTANTFYTSLGLPSMENSFNTSKGAVIEKPKNRSILCHASAWDFCNKRDYRIKMCAKVSYQDFVTIHHEMGHILYYKLYQHHPIAYRAGANPGFHEAVGDAIALSVTNPHHLEAIGLLEDYEHSTKSSINFLMDMALERLAFMPFGYILDKWRWDIFAQRINPEQWNDQYWKYREKYQKIKAPVPRTDSDFDAGSKFHVAGDAQYMSYFVAHILEFQIHRALCYMTGQYQPEDSHYPLHKCDLFTCHEAGKRLRKGLSLGASKHWTYVLEKITGEKKLSAGAIREYFDPLYNFLVKQNKLNGSKK